MIHLITLKSILKALFMLRNKYITSILLSTLFFFIYSNHTLNRHFNFDSHAFDLGIYTQAIYLYSEGSLPFSTLKHMIILADHFGPILIILAPIYKLFSSAETLLILQALFVSLSAIPIYLIAIKELKNITLSLLITLAFLTSVAITSAVIFDFHLATISVLPLSIILYSWYFKKWLLYSITLFLSILFKEDLPIFLLGIGIYQTFCKQYRIGFPTIIFSLLSLYLIKFTIMPFLWRGGDTSYIESSILPLDSPIDLISLLLLRPQIFLDQIFNSQVKLLTLDALLKPFAFLPVLSPLTYLTSFLHLYFRFASNYHQTWTTVYHHSAPVLPFLAFSTILVIGKFKLPKFPVIVLLLFSLLTSGLSPNSFVWSFFQPHTKNSGTYSYIEKNLAIIPTKASVSAQSPLVPHLANREKIYLFPEIYDAEYLVFDKSLSSYPIHYSDLVKVINTFSKSPNWKIIAQEKNLFIFRRI